MVGYTFELYVLVLSVNYSAIYEFKCMDSKIYDVQNELNITSHILNFIFI